jgi:hypothetical protein
MLAFPRRPRRGAGFPATAAGLPALALAAAAAAATLAPAAPARANDRDLRGTPIPAAACSVWVRQGFEDALHGAVGGYNGAYYGVRADKNRRIQLGCPLPVNAIDLSGATDDNDVSKFRVHYRDPDGFGNGTTLTVDFYRTTRTTTGHQLALVKSWSSDVGGGGATGATTAVVALPQDLATGVFYSFQVMLTVLPVPGAPTLEFAGIDFPP